MANSRTVAGSDGCETITLVNSHTGLPNFGSRSQGFHGPSSAPSRTFTNPWKYFSMLAEVSEDAERLYWFPRRQSLAASHCCSYDARLIRIQSCRRDRIDCRGARRNRVARIERQYLQQTMAAMSAAEALRSDLINRIDLRVAGEARKLV
jgi:hypothetical protein